MTRDTKVRLIAFIVLSVVALTYVGANYLGIVDRALGRGYKVQVLLPASGGLYEGSEVTYRGVKIGRVSNMTVGERGLRVDVAMEEEAEVPASAAVRVYNLTAVGEQYISFEPTSNSGPMLQDGDTIRGSLDSLPVGEDVLLRNLSRFALDLDSEELNTVIAELGHVFRDNATPLHSMVDNAQLFLEEAQANEAPTIALLRRAQTVLQTQAEHADDIRSFASDLAAFTDTLADSDSDLRAVLKNAGPASAEVKKLMRTLQAVLPAFAIHLVHVTDVLDARLPALEQLLVTFPKLIAVGPAALLDVKGEKFGRVNLNMNQDPPPCMDGYLPPSQWRATYEESFVDFYPAECKSGPPINMRGMKYAPPPTDWKSSLTGEDPVKVAP